MADIYFSRAGRARADDVQVRTPELRALRETKLAVFGVGCLGATSVVAFARSGVSEVRIVDRDYVDPGTVARWPLGLNSAGLLKVDALREFIALNYPATHVVAVAHRIGTVREPGSDARSDREVIDTVLEGVAAIYDATAELGVQHYLSDVARERGIPYIGVVGTYGGWGGKIVCVDPKRTVGCWMCYRCALNDGTIPEPPSDPAGEIQPRGCGDVTFTGAGFDMETIALAGVRMAAPILCDGAEGSYPPADWDVMTIALRDDDGKHIAPRFCGFGLAKHPRCPCNTA